MNTATKNLENDHIHILKLIDVMKSILTTKNTKNTQSTQSQNQLNLVTYKPFVIFV